MLCYKCLGTKMLVSHLYVYIYMLCYLASPASTTFLASAIVSTSSPSSQRFFFFINNLTLLPQQE